MQGGLLIIAEVVLLAAAQLLGGPPWMVVTAVAVVLQSAAGLTPMMLARLALAFVWLGLFRLTGNRELFFCFVMALATHLAILFAARRWMLGAAAGGLMVAVFLGFRVGQQATLKVLAVETAVAVVILIASLVAHQLRERQHARREVKHSQPVNAGMPSTSSIFLSDTAIVIAASIAAYAGLAL